MVTTVARSQIWFGLFLTFFTFSDTGFGQHTRASATAPRPSVGLTDQSGSSHRDSHRRPAAMGTTQQGIARTPGFATELTHLRSFPGFLRLAFDGDGKVYEVIPGSLQEGEVKDPAGVRELTLDDQGRILQSQPMLVETLAEARSFNLSR